jgi:molybdopterin biosynthesis enzyme MoaB
MIKHSLVITLPGSPRGAIETLDALFPYVLHVAQVAKGMRHDK